MFALFWREVVRWDVDAGDQRVDCRIDNILDFNVAETKFFSTDDPSDEFGIVGGFKQGFEVAEPFDYGILSDFLDVSSSFLKILFDLNDVVVECNGGLKV